MAAFVRPRFLLMFCRAEYALHGTLTQSFLGFFVLAIARARLKHCLRRKSNRGRVSLRQTRPSVWLACTKSLSGEQHSSQTSSRSEAFSAGMLLRLDGLLLLLLLLLLSSDVEPSSFESLPDRGLPLETEVVPSASVFSSSCWLVSESSVSELESVSTWSSSHSSSVDDSGGCSEFESESDSTYITASAALPSSHCATRNRPEI